MKINLCNYLIFLLLGTIILIGLKSCDSENKGLRNFDKFSVYFNKSSSWVDYSYEATIDQTGLMKISEINGLRGQNRNVEYYISEIELILVKEKLKDLININISDRYGFDNEDAPTDLPVNKFVYETPYKSDSSSMYFPEENELPIELESLLLTLEQIIIQNDTLTNN